MKASRLCALLALFAWPAFAEEAPCGPRADIVSQLAERYGEVRQSAGFDGEAIFEIYANTETGSWSILRSMANGDSCLMVAGQNYRAEKPTPFIPGKDA